MHILRYVICKFCIIRKKIQRTVYKLCKLYLLCMNFRDMGKAKSKWGTLGCKHILTTLITEIALLHFRSGSHK